MPTIAELLTELDDATAALITQLAGLTDAETREPSLLPGWSRGHTLTHLARNAEGGTRLLTWARTGEPSYEYRSVPAGAQAIEDGASRPRQNWPKTFSAPPPHYTKRPRPCRPAPGSTRSPGPPGIRPQPSTSRRASTTPEPAAGAGWGRRG